mmetsp:Transcript_89333/g.277875  ORF Transcript_89333/g.277875 Transcript_89333/m.277875 type:complete len:242 (+) Transcript_89333:896-1621(+)
MGEQQALPQRKLLRIKGSLWTCPALEHEKGVPRPELDHVRASWVQNKRDLDLRSKPHALPHKKPLNRLPRRHDDCGLLWIATLPAHEEAAGRGLTCCQSFCRCQGTSAPHGEVPRHTWPPVHHGQHQLLLRLSRRGRVPEEDAAVAGKRTDRVDAAPAQPHEQDCCTDSQCKKAGPHNNIPDQSGVMAKGHRNTFGGTDIQRGHLSCVTCKALDSLVCPYVEHTDPAIDADQNLSTLRRET